MKTLLAVALLSPIMAAQAPPRNAAGPSSSGFACNRLALDPEERKRHFEILGPALRAMHKQVRELADGFEFEFAGDGEIVQKVAEWAAGERRCCPFFDIELRFAHDHDGLWLRLTGREGVKQFIRTDLAKWITP